MFNNRTRPRLESLESRLAPSVDVNSAFVASVFHGLLGRNVDAGGLAFWTNQLRSTSRQQVVAGIENSNEFVSRELQLFFKTLLGRNVDQAGLNFFGHQLQTGATVQQVKAAIMGSDEFFSHAGASIPGFLSAVFRDTLGRGLTPTDLAFFAGTPNTVSGRTAAALEILNSAEANNVEVTGMFDQILGRRPGAADLLFWDNQLRNGASDAAVVAGIAGSAEFIAALRPFATTSATFDPDTVAAVFIASRGLFNGVLAGVEQLTGNLRTDVSLVVQPLPPATNAPVTGNVVVAATTATGNVVVGVTTTTGPVAVAAFQGGTFVSVTMPMRTPTPIYTGATTIYQTTLPTTLVSTPAPVVVTSNPSFQRPLVGPTIFTMF
jgi:hypothetical protein